MEGKDHNYIFLFIFMKFIDVSHLGGEECDKNSWTPIYKLIGQTIH